MVILIGRTFLKKHYTWVFFRLETEIYNRDSAMQTSDHLESFSIYLYSLRACWDVWLAQQACYVEQQVLEVVVLYVLREFLQQANDVP